MPREEGAGAKVCEDRCGRAGRQRGCRYRRRKVQALRCARTVAARGEAEGLPVPREEGAGAKACEDRCSRPGRGRQRWHGPRRECRPSRGNAHRGEQGLWRAFHAKSHMFEDFSNVEKSEFM